MDLLILLITVHLIIFNNQFHFSEKSSQNKAMIVNYDGANLASSSSDYRMPLVWIDLEMTGESFIPPIINHMLAGASAPASILAAALLQNSQSRFILLQCMISTLPKQYSL
jgi:hypothetical protein